MSSDFRTLLEENSQNFTKSKSDVKNKQQNICQFFLKTSSCQFGPLCYKKHPSPKMSSTLMVQNMFKDQQPGLVSRFLFSPKFRLINDEDFPKTSHSKLADLKFRKFYHDILPEFEKFGRIKQILTCKNSASHLKGNVYIFYYRVSDAVQCFNEMNGRFYGGFPLSIQFSYLVSGNEALCSFGNSCPVLDRCNFLHVFKSPRKRSRSPKVK